MASKKKGKPERDSEDDEQSPAKKLKIEEYGDIGEGGSKRKGPTTTSTESDEEFILGSDVESGEEAYSYSEGDSSDIDDEDDEEIEEDGGLTAIVTGVQVELHCGSGKYSILHKEDCKELKMLLPDKVMQSSITTAKELQQKNLIPMFEAMDVEITRDDEIELIVYANEITLSKDELPFSGVGKELPENMAAADKVPFKENCWCVIKIENVLDLFATQDFQQ